MNTPKKQRKPASRVTKGFALVVSLTMLVLLTIIAVGLLSLSAVTLRTTSQNSAQAEAQANARLALMIAIGELQKHTGADTRVTAPADILNAGAPPLTGVWRSWEGMNHDSDGRPIAPDYDSKTKAEGDGGRFLAWLVSGDPTDVGNIDEASQLVRTTPFSQSVPLLSEGTLGSNSDRQVHVVPSELDNGGRYAWWISGENQKARLPDFLDTNDPNYPSTSGEWSDVVKSNATTDPSVFGLDSLLTDPTIANKAISRSSMALLGSDDPDFGSHFHSLTPYSAGLLTNVATGGWKKDLSLFSERTDHSNLDRPLFRVSPDQTLNYDWPTTSSPTQGKLLLYPWSNYVDRGSLAYQKIGPVASWANLVSWASHYKRAEHRGSGVFSTPMVYPNLNSSSGADIHEFLHVPRMAPLMARIQFILSLEALADQETPNNYYPTLLITPVVTLWNPYNVSVTLPENYRMFVNKALPAVFDFGFDGVFDGIYQRLMAGNGSQYGSAMKGSKLRDDGSKFVAPNPLFILRINMEGPHVFNPGEARVFSPPPGYNNIFMNDLADYESGLRMDVGWRIGITGDSNPDNWVSHPGSTNIGIRAHFDNLTDLQAAGIHISSFIQNITFNIAQNKTLFTEEVAQTLNPSMTEDDLSTITLSSAAGGPLPVMSIIYGPRISSSGTRFASKGMVQGNPFTQNIASGPVSQSLLDHQYNGSDHPVNIHYDYIAIPHSPSGDSEFQNITEESEGFVVSGRTAGDGLTRCIIAELPVRPIASLVELTNWDLRMENPVPPFSFNVIGNSDASPLIPSDSVVGANSPGDSINLQHDDSYCANHLLFDDWFASSISEDPGPSGERTMQVVFEDFVLGNKALPNRSYQPLSKDQAAAHSGGATRLYQDEVNSQDAWQTIASRLEVEGMFNVNSMSVQAWRALLGHARGMQVPHFTSATAVGLSNPVDYAFSRFPKAADTATGDPGISGAFEGASEITGYRVLDDTFLDSLAEEIVEQVRIRGPFLSLAEFVNRQLDSSTSNLTLAGAIQTALNEVVASNDTFSALEQYSGVSESDPPGDENYQYRDAAVGSSAYGLPGWTRQADVLRPIAPILSARDDTFTIRAYGDARDSSGNITTRAHCEAVVRRTREYVDPEDVADSTSAPNSSNNLKYGRRYEIVSFRWLHADEV